jgi:hypothetical protein
MTQKKFHASGNYHPENNIAEGNSNSMREETEIVNQLLLQNKLAQYEIFHYKAWLR